MEIKLVDAVLDDLINGFNHHHVAVVYLNNKLKRIKSNAYADALLDKNQCVSLHNEQLITSNREEMTKLSIALQTALEQQETSSVFLKKIGDSNIPCRLDIYPIGKLFDKTKYVSAMMILINRTSLSSTYLNTEFQKFYELTPSESLLVDAIVEGTSLDQYAQSRNIKISTVRWTLANVFSKTTTHSQSELLSLARIFYK